MIKIRSVIPAGFKRANAPRTSDIHLCTFATENQYKILLILSWSHEMITDQLKPITITIDPCDDYPLSLSEIKYTFETLLSISGFPWSFIPVDINTPCDIYFGHRWVEAKQANLQIRMNVVRKLSRPIGTRKETLKSNRSIVLLYFSNDEKILPYFVDNGDRIVTFNNDIILSSFFLLLGWEENLIKRDRNDIHEIQLSFLYQNDLLHTPIINQYALLFRDVFSTTNYFLPSWPQDKKYAVALSHDVDYPELIPSIEIVRYLISKKSKSSLSKIHDILYKKESFFKFHEWMTLENKYAMKSAFYFCGFVGSLIRYLFIAPDPFYDVGKKNFKETMYILDKAGFEVGLHASYYAYRSEQQLRIEKENLEHSFGKAISGNRHHYWHLNPINPSETARMHADIGLLYDSSMAFDKASGFRRGICSPFHLYDRDRQSSVNIPQLPTALMDTHLFKHSRIHNFDSYQNHIRSLINEVRTYKGVLTVDYHVRVINNTFFPDYGKSYEFLLENITAEKDYYCDTPINVIRHWMHREKTLRDMSRSVILT